MYQLYGNGFQSTEFRSACHGQTGTLFAAPAPAPAPS
jgi:hypothetical protein